VQFLLEPCDPQRDDLLLDDFLGGYEDAAFHVGVDQPQAAEPVPDMAGALPCLRVLVGKPRDFIADKEAHLLKAELRLFSSTAQFRQKAALAGKVDILCDRETVQISRRAVDRFSAQLKPDRGLFQRFSCSTSAFCSFIRC
jgi:hypothetical protein